MENTEENKPIQNQNQIVGAIIIAGMMIAGAILLKGSTGPTAQRAQVAPEPQKPEVIALDVRAVTDQDHIVGSKDAQITIVEFSDTECPYCKKFQVTLQKITKERPEVAWVYRHYPIPELHPQAPHQAEATECAWEQGGNTVFWKYIDRLFSITPSGNGLDEKELMNIADYVGLNSSAFYTCLSSGKYADKVRADITDGLKADIHATPISVIITQKEITAQMQSDIFSAVNNDPEAVSFGSPQKNRMRLNGNLPIGMVNKILDILSK